MQRMNGYVFRSELTAKKGNGRIKIKYADG